MDPWSREPGTFCLPGTNKILRKCRKITKISAKTTESDSKWRNFCKSDGKTTTYVLSSYQRDLTRPPQQMVKFWYNFGVFDLKRFLSKNADLFYKNLGNFSPKMIPKFYQKLFGKTPYQSHKVRYI